MDKSFIYNLLLYIWNLIFDLPLIWIFKKLIRGDFYNKKYEELKT